MYNLSRMTQTYPTNLGRPFWLPSVGDVVADEQRNLSLNYPRVFFPSTPTFPLGSSGSTLLVAEGFCARSHIPGHLLQGPSCVFCGLCSRDWSLFMTAFSWGHLFVNVCTSWLGPGESLWEPLLVVAPAPLSGEATRLSPRERQLWGRVCLDC